MLLPLLLSCDCPAPAGAACPEATVTVDGATLHADQGACGGLDLEGRVLGDGEFELRLEVGERGVLPVVVGQGTLRGVVLEGTWTLDGDEAARLWRQGYQSWSWSGVVEPSEPTLDEEGVPEVGGDGDNNTALLDTAWSSWWVGLIGRDGGRSLVLGAVGATRTRVFLAFSPSRAWVVWGTRGEALNVDGSLAIDPLHVAFGADPSELLEAYAQAVAAETGAAPAGDPPTGWATWYQFYAAVTEEDVRANLAVAASLADDADLAPLQVFQLDDGWQRRWGDWSAGDDFPSGTAALAAEIAGAGFVPGLWMAPFYVSRDSAVYQAHADWWVRDEDGDELRFTNLGSGDYAVVDATHPEAGAWMAAQVADKVAEGWAYLKLDFLYAGAQEGRRYEDVTGVEAYRVGLDLLRGAAGDAWVLACGAPLLPTVGFADSFRTGSDIAFDFDPDPDPAYLRWAARSTAARGWTNGRWWWADPDQLLLREPTSDTAVTGAVVAQAVSGGPWLLGDDLGDLPAERLALALDPKVVALRGQAVRPADPLAFPSGLDAGPTIERALPDDQVPRLWVFSDGTTALLNLSDEAVTVPGPGGLELLSGEEAPAGDRTLAPGAGELWRP